MKFEKLNDNKIKIILTIKDLEEKNIDFHSFMSNSIESQSLFIDMLKEAEKKIGFVTNNYNIHIEAFATSDGIFVFTITRVSTINIPKKKKVVYTRKLLKQSKRFIIYSFNSFDDYCNFCAFLKKHFSNFDDYLKNVSLVLHNSTYFIVLYDTNMDKLIATQFFSYISEFANLCNTSELFARKLLEHGEVIVPNNAIKVGINYFT